MVLQKYIGFYKKNINNKWKNIFFEMRA